jgi:AP-3 complex subunit delta
MSIKTVSLSALTTQVLTVVVKYVSLLAFEKIVVSHPYLVSMQQDVILECIDDPDISIRMLALNLVVGMVNSDNITEIVDRLLRQLAYKTSLPTEVEEPNSRYDSYDESDDDNRSEKPKQTPKDDVPQIPDEYRLRIIQRILDMCSKDTYSNLNDFEWYIQVLMELVKACPTPPSSGKSLTEDKSRDISYAVGDELQNIAVRVQAVRSEATLAAQTLVLLENRDRLFPAYSNGGQGVLEACGWIVGEYARNLSHPKAVLDSLIHSSTAQLPPHIVIVYIQAAIKVFARSIADQESSWTPKRRTESTLLMARVIYFLEPLTTHHDLEVQEIAVEYLELMRLASEAASGQPVSDDGEYVDPPLLLTQAIPSLFNGSELNPVAPGAQHKVELPEDLDLDTPINANLQSILMDAEKDELEIEHDSFIDLYNKKSVAELSVAEPLYDPTMSAADRLDAVAKSEGFSYQADDSSGTGHPKHRKRNKDDPFYIGSGVVSDEDATTAEMHSIIRSTNNGETLDLDAIPVLPLGLEGGDGSPSHTRQDEQRQEAARRRKKLEARKNIQIAADETIGSDENTLQSPSLRRPGLLGASNTKGNTAKKPRSLLNIDTSGLKSLSLEGSSAASPMLDVEQREEEERALRDVERLRLEMERAAERIQAREEAVVVKKKKKKRDKSKEDSAAGVDGEGVEKKKKKKRRDTAEAVVATEENPVGDLAAIVEVKKKKKKRRAVDLTSGSSEPSQPVEE